MLSTGGPGRTWFPVDIETPGRVDHDDGGVAVAMLKRLIDEHGEVLRGLRGFVYDTALSATNIDEVLGMRILPITRVRRINGGKPVHCRLGAQSFIVGGGTRHDLEVVVDNDGAPAVELADSSGDPVVVALRRWGVLWGGHGIPRSLGYGGYVIPDDPAVPGHLTGATTFIRFNSTPVEVAAGPDTRRTRWLRPVPESDPDFGDLIGVRDNAEAALDHLKRRTARLNAHDQRVRIITEWLLILARVRSGH